MGQTDRLMDIWLYIVKNREFTAGELADKFGVSSRTIARDLDHLSVLGVPLYSLKGKGGGYKVLDSVQLPPISFSEDELKSILFAYYMLEKAGDNPFQIEIAAVQEKLRCQMPEYIQEKTAELTSHHPLQEGIILKRNSQFTMDVLLNGETICCHCPATTRIADVDMKNIACLVSYHDDPKRKLKYDVEAVSFDNPEESEKNWVGINLILSNRLVEFLLETHQLDAMVSGYSEIHREVPLGNSKLDFLVGNTYLEVKTPLTTINVKYGSHIKTKKVTPFSSTGRFQKHILELAGSLKNHERAILLTVNQYVPTQMKPHLKSTHYEEVREDMEKAVAAGIETWNIDMKFEPDGVTLVDLAETTQDVLSY